jgi:sigma-B regulation protein RsbU (phosphoserine phosphatase)
MGIARRIQASLLPSKPPRIPGAELAGACIPARNVGGDYYDLIPLPGGRVALLIADVSGHNVGAALMMAVSRAVLRSCIQTDPAPEKVLAAANALLLDDLARSELFISVFVAVYDPAARMLAFANGGHNKPLLLRAGGAAEEWLDAEGILLGVIEGADFERKEIPFGPGDLLFLYTDGLPEAHGDDGVQWGEDRMAALVRRDAGAPLADVPVRLLEELDRFTGVPAGDDRTMVLLRGAS